MEKSGFLLDGLKPYYNEVTSVATAGFHEYFGDAIALTAALDHRKVVVEVAGRQDGVLTPKSLVANIGQQFGQGLADGACAVLFPRAVAPHSKMGISVIAAIVLTIMTCLVLGYSFLVNYYAGVGFGTVLWQVVLFLLPIISAWVAVLYAHGEANRVLST